MKGFIEVTDVEDGLKIALSVNQIKSVIQLDDGTAGIELVETRRNVDDVILCQESYESVVFELNEIS